MDELASVTPGKEARAMSSFANALRWSCISPRRARILCCYPLFFNSLYNQSSLFLLFDAIVIFVSRQLPSIIAENGGYDSAQLVSELKAKHILGESTMVSFGRLN